LSGGPGSARTRRFIRIPDESRMGILPDHWIREQAQRHGMIEPFV
jgi:hypothetical protein